MSLYQIDTFVIGDDWKGQFDFIANETNTEIIYLTRTPEISTTQIKKDLNDKNLVKKNSSVLNSNLIDK